MVNRYNKDNAMISRPLHTEADVGKKTTSNNQASSLTGIVKVTKHTKEEYVNYRYS